MVHLDPMGVVVADLAGSDRIPGLAENDTVIGPNSHRHVCINAAAYARSTERFLFDLPRPRLRLRFHLPNEIGNAFSGRHTI